jgi:hypothetical protein
MALPAAMISVYKPLAQRYLFAHAAKKDSIGTFERPPIRPLLRRALAILKV